MQIYAGCLQAEKLLVAPVGLALDIRSLYDPPKSFKSLSIQKILIINL